MKEPLEDLPPVYRKLPIYYITNRFTVVGPGAEVRWPRYSEVMDYELEIGVLTRRARANIPAKEAGRHIFGYTIFNDFSARDRQAIEMQGRLGPAKGKSFDGSNAMGPWIVTPDELGDPQTLEVEVRVKERRAQRARPARCCFPSRSSSPKLRRTRRSTRESSSARALSAIAADWRSAAFSKAAIGSSFVSTGSARWPTRSCAWARLETRGRIVEGGDDGPSRGRYFRAAAK
jgi:Fumarylacetoacetate (FAA) hydrolase family